MNTTARRQAQRARELVQALADEETELLKELVQAAPQEALEAEGEHFLAPAPDDRMRTRASACSVRRAPAGYPDPEYQFCTT